jgi:hypothetical protein
VPEPMIDGTERLGIKTVEAVAADAVFADQAGTAEQAEVLGDGGAGDGKGAGDLAGGLVALAKEIENGAAGGVGQGAKDGVRRMGNRTVSHNE